MLNHSAMALRGKFWLNCDHIDEMFLGVDCQNYEILKYLQKQIIKIEQQIKADSNESL